MIEIDDETFDYLKQHAEPFVDTPATVLRRLIGLGDRVGESTVVPANTHRSTATPSRPEDEERAGPSSSVGPKGHRKKGRRAVRGSLLAETEYEIPILAYLDGQGGRAPSREVVEGVGEALKDQLTQVDKEKLRSGDIRWKNRVAFVRLRLIEKGDLDGHAPRGTWAITPQGKERVARNNN